MKQKTIWIPAYCVLAPDYCLTTNPSLFLVRKKSESCETNQGYWKCFQGSLKRRQNPFSQYGAIILISFCHCHCHCHFDHNHDICNCHRFFSLALVFLGAIAMFANVIVILTIWLRVPLFLSLLLKLLLSLNRRYNPFSQHEAILALPGGSSDIGMYIWLLGWKEDKLRRFWK